MQNTSIELFRELTDLPLLFLRITARAVDRIRLPDHSASSLRGAFGSALRRLVCVQPHPATCEFCDPQQCVFPSLFAPRAQAGQPGSSGFQDLPRPYVIRPASQVEAAPNETFYWSVTLVGGAIQQLPYFVLAWRAMGEAGIGAGRGRFHLQQVEELDLEERSNGTLYERAANRLHSPTLPLSGEQFQAWSEAMTAKGKQSVLQVRFLTPTSLRHQSRAVQQPEFHHLWRAVQLRLSLLRYAHGSGRPQMDFQAAIHAAEAVRLEGWTAETVTWQRYSHRQESRVPMRGFLGVATYRGDFLPFLSALKAASLTGVGDNCTFGQGVYTFSFPEETAET